jgi:hypothetical protein
MNKVVGWSVHRPLSPLFHLMEADLNPSQTDLNRWFSRIGQATQGGFPF